MTDADKIIKVEEALRMERDMLRGRKPINLPDGIEMPRENDLGTANTLNYIIQSAGGDTKLRLYELLTR